MDKFKAKAKIWFYCLLWLVLTISIAACLSFACEKFVEKVNGYKIIDWFWLSVTFIVFFQSHFIPNLIALTVIISVTEFPPISILKVPKLLFGVILPMNLFITSFHIDFVFHKFPKTVLMRNAILFFIVINLSLSILEKLGQTFLKRLNTPKPFG